MLNKRRISILVLVVSLTVVTSYLAQAVRKDQAAAKQDSPVVLKEKANEDRVRNKVATILTHQGIRLGNELATSNAQTHRQLRIHWRSFGKSDSNGLLKPQQLDASSSLSRTSWTIRTGILPRERSFELSPDRIFVAALDETEAVRWWRLMVDPRLVRAEVGNPSEMQSEQYYLSDVDLILECPDDPALKQLRLYRPVWDGQDFQLQLTGSIALD